MWGTETIAFQHIVSSEEITAWKSQYNINHNTNNEARLLISVYKAQPFSLSGRKCLEIAKVLRLKQRWVHIITFHGLQTRAKILHRWTKGGSSFTLPFFFIPPFRDLQTWSRNRLAVQLSTTNTSSPTFSSLCPAFCLWLFKVIGSCPSSLHGQLRSEVADLNLIVWRESGMVIEDLPRNKGEISHHVNGRIERK